MDKPAGKGSSSLSTSKIALPILVLALLLSLGLSAYLFTQMRKLEQDPQRVAQAEAEALIAEVSEHIDLPAGETPTIATVSDPEQLKTQAFFTNAEKGDKVLLYTNAKKAILYSPSKHKIVEVAPVNIGTGTTTAQGEGEPTVAGETTEDTTVTP